MSKSQYDKNDVADNYVATTEKEISRLYIENPNMLRVIGGVQGLDVLGVGCGDGYLESMLKEAGAQRVVGADLSADMLSLARKHEDQQHQGIEYLQADLTQMPRLGAFDLVTAKYVLNYGKDREQLRKMCEGAYRNLKAGGRLVALVPDYDLRYPENHKYGFTARPLAAPAKEGDKLEITIYSGDKPGVVFQCHYWKKQSYEQALREVGFRDITWHSPMPSKEGIERLGSEFWADWINRPLSAIVEAVK